jgi:hypothetical protein
MFAPSIQLESISFFEPAEGVWREETVNAPARDDRTCHQDGDDEDFEAFCRRSLL